MSEADSGDSRTTTAKGTLLSQWSHVSRVLGNPVGIRGLVMIVAGAVLLFSPDLTALLVLVVALVLVGLAGFGDLAYSATGRRVIGPSGRRWVAAIRGVLGIGIAGVLAYMALEGSASLTLSLLVGVVGVYVGVRGLILIVAAIARRRVQSIAEPVAMGGIAIAVGALSFLVPASLVNALILLVATLGVILGLVLLAWSAKFHDGASSLDPHTASSTEVLWDWIHLSDIGRSDRATLAETLYFESPGTFTKQATWWVMLVLSVAIATFAVLADSTAVVIGAMLVAPLMLTSESILAGETEARHASRVVNEWLGEESGFVVLGIDVESCDVSVAISGSGTHPEAEVLAALLSDELSRQVTVRLSVSPVEVTVASSPPR